MAMKSTVRQECDHLVLIGLILSSLGLITYSSDSEELNSKLKDAILVLLVFRLCCPLAEKAFADLCLETCLSLLEMRVERCFVLFKRVGGGVDGANLGYTARTHSRLHLSDK